GHRPSHAVGDALCVCGPSLREQMGRMRNSVPGAAAGPGRLRSFDPGRIADLEYRAWVAYYRRQWLQVLAAAVGLVHAGFGMDWRRTLHGDWLVLRANQL